MSKYIVISPGSESDDHRVEILDAADLKDRITPGQHGDTWYGGERGVRFVKTLEEVREPYDENQPMPLMIFKVGEPVVPKTVEIVTRYDLE